MSTPFTPGSALAGGLLIGAAALVLLHTPGRIAGVSGIVGAALRPGLTPAERLWRAAFIAGLILGPLVATAMLGRTLIQPSPTRAPVLILAGLAVGIGTGLASGCTSGHGVCGVSRLSRRSIVATAVFMAVGVLTASVLRRLIGA